MSYQKVMKTVTFTLIDKSTVVAQDTRVDTEMSMVGSNALAAFKAGETAEVPYEGTVTLIPFHAVLKVEVNKVLDTINKADDEFCNAVECDCETGSESIK